MKGVHSFAKCLFLDLTYGCSSGDGLSHVLGDNHDLVYTDSSLITEVVALLASVGLINGDILIHALGRNVHKIFLGNGCKTRFLAERAKSSNKSLCNNADN